MTGDVGRQSYQVGDRVVLAEALKIDASVNFRWLGYRDLLKVGAVGEVIQVRKSTQGVLMYFVRFDGDPHEFCIPAELLRLLGDRGVEGYLTEEKLEEVLGWWAHQGCEGTMVLLVDNLRRRRVQVAALEEMVRVLSDEVRILRQPHL